MAPKEGHSFFYNFSVLFWDTFRDQNLILKYIIHCHGDHYGLKPKLLEHLEHNFVTVSLADTPFQLNLLTQFALPTFL